MTLDAKGWNVTLVLDSGRKVRGAKGAALLHDESGRQWPADSGLIMPFSRRGSEPLEDADGKTRKYFGDDYALRAVRVALPPASLRSWTRVGRVARIDYTRRGAFADDFYHPFERAGLVWKTDLPVLYRRGRVLRIEGVRRWSWRGFL